MLIWCYARWLIAQPFSSLCFCYFQGNSKALATVTAIIDGMGSIGAAIGPMMTGYISEIGGFDLVFVMLYLSALMAGLLIIKLAAKEYATLRGRK